MSIKINDKKVNDISFEENAVRYVYQGGTQIFPSGFNLDKACSTTSAASGNQYIRITLPRKLGPTMGFRAGVRAINYIDTYSPCLFTARTAVGAAYGCFGLKNSYWRIDGTTQVSLDAIKLNENKILGVGNGKAYCVNGKSAAFTGTNSTVNTLTMFQSTQGDAAAVSNPSVLAVNFLDMWDEDGWILQMRPIAVGDVNPITNEVSTKNGMINILDGTIYGSNTSNQFSIINW